MNLLLDTHAWLWTILEPDRLSSAARDAIEHGDARYHLSAITFWEVALLEERGVVDLDGDLDAWFAYALREYPVTELPITRAVAVASRRVPLEHRDPADRFLAATAVVHDLVLVTRDQRLLDAEGLPTLAA